MLLRTRWCSFLFERVSDVQPHLWYALVYTGRQVAADKYFASMLGRFQHVCPFSGLPRRFTCGTAPRPDHCTDILRLSCEQLSHCYQPLLRTAARVSPAVLEHTATEQRWVLVNFLDSKRSGASNCVVGCVPITSYWQQQRKVNGIERTQVNGEPVGCHTEFRARLRGTKSQAWQGS